MTIEFPEMGICGLSCQLCPNYQSNSNSKCDGCKSEARMKVGCPFITCAIKKKGIEFCWDCEESSSCEKWRRHREMGKAHDSFKCYQKLEDDISYVQQHGFTEYKKLQNTREEILKDMLNNFNDGRSKSYYCIAATIMEIEELEQALSDAKESSVDQDLKAKAKILHKLLDDKAKQKGYFLGLRK
jgi:hypothetical protein